MSKYTDGKKTVEIIMHTWNGNGYDPSWEADFFCNGLLPYDEETETFRVQDVDYLIEQANDWKMGVGEYGDELEGEPGHTPETRIVDVEVLEG